MSPPPTRSRPSLLPEDSSAEPQVTPPEDRVLRRAMDTATIRLHTWGSLALVVALLGGAAVSQVLPLVLGAP